MASGQGTITTTSGGQGGNATVDVTGDPWPDTSPDGSTIPWIKGNPEQNPQKGERWKIDYIDGKFVLVSKVV